MLQNQLRKERRRSLKYQWYGVLYTKPERAGTLDNLYISAPY